jgi:hypothetical protein
MAWVWSLHQTVGGAETRVALPPETARFKAGPGVEVATAQCLICHSADYVSTQPRMGRSFWKANVQKMQQKYGAPIPDNQVERVVDYLVQAYGKETAAAPRQPNPGTPTK